MTKAPCKFHLLQGACSSPVVCSASLFLPCSLQDYGCGACVPDAMQHGRSVLQPLASLSRTWAAAMMRCRPGTLQSSGVSIGARHASPLRSRSILARAFSCSLRYEGNVRDNPRNRCERESLNCGSPAHPEFGCNLRGGKPLRLEPLKPGVRVGGPKASRKVAHFCCNRGRPIAHGLFHLEALNTHAS